MDNYTKQVIERYSGLIEANDWKTFYIKLRGVYDNSSIGEITEMLLKAGIDPLDELDYIPENYLAGASIKEFKVPGHIEIIEEDAFNACYQLESIYFPASLELVKFRAFRNCKSLQDIFFDGTEEQFKQIQFEKYWHALIRHSITIHCNDREFVTLGDL